MPSQSIQLWRPSHDALQVRYIYQRTKEVLADVAEAPDDRFLLGQVARHLAVWDGHRAPQRVCEQEAWKCHHCQFNEHCWRRVAEPAEPDRL